jgi:hypothetical protein
MMRQFIPRTALNASMEALSWHFPLHDIGAHVELAQRLTVAHAHRMPWHSYGQPLRHALALAVSNDFAG